MTDALLVSQILLWVGFLGLTLVMAAVLRQLGVLFERVAPAGALSMNSRLKVGDVAPRFSVSNLEGRVIDIGESSSSGRNTLLLFLSTDCAVCKELMPAIVSFLKRERRTTDVVFVGSGQEQGHREYAAANGLSVDRYAVSDEIGMAYAVSKLPYAVLIDEHGVIASFGLVNNREHIESLLEAKQADVPSIQEYMKKSA